MFQKKEKDKTPEEQLNEVEIGNLHEKKNIRVVIVKMIQDLRGENGGTDREITRTKEIGYGKHKYTKINNKNY